VLALAVAAASPGTGGVHPHTTCAQMYAERSGHTLDTTALVVALDAALRRLEDRRTAEPGR
jgi:hypothetical protein